MATIDPGSVANTVNNVGSSSSGGTSSLPSLPTLTPQPVNLSLILHLDSVAIVASTAIVQALNGNFSTPRTPNAPGTPTPTPAPPSGIDPRQLGSVAHVVGSVANSGSVGGGVVQAVTGTLSMLGPEGMAAAAAIGAITAVVAAVVAATKKIGSNMQEATEAVLNGIGSLTSAAFQVGTKIGTTALGAILKPFGVSGEAITGTVSKTLSTVGELAAKTFSSIVPVIGKVAAVVGGLGAFLAGGGLLGGLIISGLSKVVGSALGSIMTAAGSALGQVGDLANEVFKGALSVLDDILGSVTKLAGAAATLSQNSGMSLAQASTANNLLAGFGIKATDVEGLSRNTFIESTVTRSLGIQGAVGSAEFLDSFRDRYRQMAFNPDGSSNPIGLLQAQARAKGAGLEALIPLASMPDAVYNRQQQHSQQLQSSLGMTPAQIEKANYDWMSLTATVSQAAGLIKSKFAADLMPTLTRELDKGISWISSHSGQITQGLQTAATWLTTTLPQDIIKGARWAVSEFDSLAHRVGGFLNGIGDFLGGLGDNKFFNYVVGALTVVGAEIDTVTTVLNTQLHVAGKAIIFFGNSLVDVANIVISAANMLVTTISALGSIPGIRLVPKVGEIIDAISGIHFDSIAKIDPASLDKIDLRTHLASAAGDFADKTLPGLTDAFHGYGDEVTKFGDDKSKTAGGYIDALEGFFGTPDDIKAIRAATEATAKHTGALADRADTSTAEFMDRAAALTIRSWYRKQSLA